MPNARASPFYSPPAPNINVPPASGVSGVLCRSGLGVVWRCGGGTHLRAARVGRIRVDGPGHQARRVGSPRASPSETCSQRWPASILLHYCPSFSALDPSVSGACWACCGGGRSPLACGGTLVPDRRDRSPFM